MIKKVTEKKIYEQELESDSENDIEQVWWFFLRLLSYNIGSSRRRQAEGKEIHLQWS